MLLIIQPDAIVPGALGVLIDTLAVSFVVEPLPFVNITISMRKLSLPRCLIIVPFALVLGAICPGHRSSSVAERPAHHLPFVAGARGVGHDFVL